MVEESTTTIELRYSQPFHFQELIVTNRLVIDNVNIYVC
ncbi:hypothetical protein J2S78_001702 [Salibacterium salarium]|nr:hypothetical protein [Salibacterium salarium]